MLRRSEFASCGLVPLGEREPFADGNASSGCLARTQLEHGLRAAPERNPPRPQVRYHPAYNEVPVEEDRVDAKAHEEHVDRRSARDQQAFVFGEITPPEQAFQTPKRSRGDRAALAENRGILANDPYDRRWLAGSHCGECICDAQEA